MTLDELYSDAIRDAYASATTAEPILHSLEFRHSAFGDENGDPISAIRIVLDVKDHAVKLEADAPADAGATVTMTGCPIDCRLPERSDTGVPECEIAADNVSRMMMPQLRRVTETMEPIMATYREHLPIRAHLGPEFVIDGFSAKRMRSTPMRVTGRLGFFDLMNASFPLDEYRQEDFRGLAQR